jgi:nucleoside-diphosphate kinase
MTNHAASADCHAALGFGHWDLIGIWVLVIGILSHYKGLLCFPPSRFSPITTASTKTGGPSMERTLIIFKPDAVQRGLCGEILTRFEKKGLQVVGMKFTKIATATAEKHYEPHKGKGFYDGLIKFMTSSPVVVLALEGKDAITIARNLMGATFGSKAAPGTIRGDFGVSNSYNLIHGSDSPESAQKELTLFFKPEELQDWKPTIQTWVYDFGKGVAE